MRRREFIALVGGAAAALALLLMSGCALPGDPIYQVESHPIPQLTQPLSIKQIEARIIMAGKRTNWQISPINSGRLEGRISWRRHSAAVAINFDRQAYSIQYRGSYNLNEGIMHAFWSRYKGQRTIHRRYNQRVRALEMAIENELSFPGS